MRLFSPMFGIAAACAAHAALAHGPQIQITGESGTITTRRLLLDGPYSDNLTAPTSVYVMPLKEQLGVWYSWPNGALMMDGTPEFFSGPGLAYGYGYDPLNPSVAPFTVGAKFQLRFVDGLKRWDGAAFVDAGDSQIESFTGGNPNAPSGTARTSDAGPFASLPIPGGAGAISFSGDGEEVHSTARFRLLGDGTTPASPSADGVYLLSLQLGISSADKEPSDLFYFVLHKNSASEVAAAVASLNFAPNQVQVVVPEPTSPAIASVGAVMLAAVRRRRKAARQP